MTTLIKADDQASFQREVLDSTVPVVVDFWAAWCGPCRMVGPEVEALAAQYGSAIKVVKVDVDANQSVANRTASAASRRSDCSRAASSPPRWWVPDPVRRSRPNWACPASPRPRRPDHACHRDDHHAAHGRGRSGRS